MGVGEIICQGKLGFVTWLQQMLQQQGKPSFKSLISQLGSNTITADNVWHPKRMSKKKRDDLAQKCFFVVAKKLSALPS